MAAVSDLLDDVLPTTAAGILSPIHDVLDLATAGALILVLGFRWPLALGLVAEAFPVTSLFPTWLAVVAFLRLKAAVGGSETP